MNIENTGVSSYIGHKFANEALFAEFKIILITKRLVIENYPKMSILLADTLQEGLLLVSK